MMSNCTLSYKTPQQNCKYHFHTPQHTTAHPAPMPPQLPAAQTTTHPPLLHRALPSPQKPTSQQTQPAQAQTPSRPPRHQPNSHGCLLHTTPFPPSRDVSLPSGAPPSTPPRQSQHAAAFSETQRVAGRGVAHIHAHAVSLPHALGSQTALIRRHVNHAYARAHARARAARSRARGLTALAAARALHGGLRCRSVVLGRRAWGRI